MVSDFTNLSEGSTLWTELETEIDSDFIDIGDEGVSVIAGLAYGEGGYGEGGYGGEDTVILNGSPTVWVNIDTP